MTDLVTLDFETYFDKEYTLSKLSTSEYVRDPRFEVLSCSIKVNDSDTEFFLGHQVRAALARIDWTRATLLAHHAHFDGFILSEHYGLVASYYADTLSMARGIYAKGEYNDLDSVASRLGKGNKLRMPDIKGKHLADLTGEELRQLELYNNADVDLCHEVYWALYDSLPQVEHNLVDMTVKMFAVPRLELDLDLALQELQRAKDERADLIIASGLTEKQLGSSPQLAAFLESRGVKPPMKRSPRTKKQTFAFAKTDFEFTALEFHPDKAVANAVKARLAVKSNIGVNRPTRLIECSRNGERPLPVYLNYCGAHTTRWSGGDKMNFQNLPREGKLRESLRAPRGFRIVVVDSAQIEARMLAWLAGEAWLVEAFRDGRDVYSEFATEAYKRPVSKADKEERFVGKTCILGLGYMMAALKLRFQLLRGGVDIPLEECEKLVDTYRAMNENIVALWEIANSAIGDMVNKVAGERKCLRWGGTDAGGYVQLPNDMFLLYPDVDCSFEKYRDGARWEEKPYNGSYLLGKKRTKIYGGLATENWIQALSRVAVGAQALCIAAEFPVVTLAHDEVVFLAPEREADDALAWGIRQMRQAPTWAPDLPLNAEGGHAEFYKKF